MTAARETAAKKKALNSDLVSTDWTYFKAAYACIKANTPTKRTEFNAMVLIEKTTGKI